MIASLLFTALALVPAGAHLMSLPNKIGMNAAEYLAAQQAYRGWAFSGVLILCGLLATGILTFALRDQPALASLAVIAFCSLVVSQIAFWLLTFPGNAQTHNWTNLPANWEFLRRRWELGHAIGAVLGLTALFTLLALDFRLVPTRA